jgi:hypothetical protein
LVQQYASEPKSPRLLSVWEIVDAGISKNVSPLQLESANLVRREK